MLCSDEIEDIDYIFDYATLTGACVVGVGEYTIGIMGNDTPLKREVVANSLDSHRTPSDATSHIDTNCLTPW